MLYILYRNRGRKRERQRRRETETERERELHTFYFKLLWQLMQLSRSRRELSYKLYTSIYLYDIYMYMYYIYLQFVDLTKSSSIEAGRPCSHFSLLCRSSAHSIETKLKSENWKYISDVNVNDLTMTMTMPTGQSDDRAIWRLYDLSICLYVYMSICCWAISAHVCAVVNTGSYRLIESTCGMHIKIGHRPSTKTLYGRHKTRRVKFAREWDREREGDGRGVDS